MANEALNAKGAVYTNIQVAASTTTGQFSGGAVSDIATAISTEAAYPLLDLQLIVSSGTSIENETVSVYRRPKADGTNQAPVPAGDYKQQFVGTFVLDGSSGTEYYYIFGLPNVDEHATYYLFNDGVPTLELALGARGRTYGTA